MVDGYAEGAAAYEGAVAVARHVAALIVTLDGQARDAVRAPALSDRSTTTSAILFLHTGCMGVLDGNVP